MWIRHRGMPEVDVAWSCSVNHLDRISLTQHDVPGASEVWPIATQMLFSFPDGHAARLRVELRTRTADVLLPSEGSCPQFVFANDQDYAYGRFLLDAQSQGQVVEHLGGVRDIFLRTLLWGALGDSVREARFAARDYLTLAAEMLPDETDPSLTQSILSSSTLALHRYVRGKTRNELAGPARAGRDAGRARQTESRPEWPAFDPRGTVARAGPLDHGHTLIAFNDPDAHSLFESERKRDAGGDGQKYAYLAEAATPKAQTKHKYFDDYLHNPSREEDWIEQSLPPFNLWNQSSLTEPYLKPALDALPQIRRDRKIFFLVDWLNSFIGGQKSAAAQTEVHEYLRTATLEPDLRLKILQAVDELDRTVKIRRNFPD
jgi:aminopeptidase N